MTSNPPLAPEHACLHACMPNVMFHVKQNRLLGTPFEKRSTTRYFRLFDHGAA